VAVDTVPSCDAFFLHVETAGAAQQVGGLVVFEPTSDGAALSLERVRKVVRDELERLPRFRQRLAPPSRWRRPRWVDVADIDWPLHISERRSADGLAGLRQIVAELAETLMPRDRPLWRLVMVRDVGPEQSSQASPGWRPTGERADASPMRRRGGSSPPLISTWLPYGGRLPPGECV
jgi:hypothetical protein